MIDFSEVKAISIPEGVVKKIVSGNVTLWQASTYKNWVQFSTESDGTTIFNGGLGYQDGLRLSSSGTTKTETYGTVTGYIPAKPGDVIRIVGVEWYSDSGNYLCAYDSSFALLGYIYGEFKSGPNSVINSANSSVLNDTDVLITLGTVLQSEAAKNIAYIRVSSRGLSASRTAGIKQTGANMIVTVNEEI